MAFQIGDYIVKPVTGVCRIEAILDLKLSSADQAKPYYLLIPLGGETGKLYVPVDHAEGALRPALTEQEARSLIQKAPNIQEISIQDEHFREHKYKEAVKSADPEQLISLIKLTYLRNKKRSGQGKRSSSVDERYFKIAESNLYTELELALNKSREEVCQMFAASAHR